MIFYQQLILTSYCELIAVLDCLLLFYRVFMIPRWLFMFLKKVGFLVVLYLIFVLLDTWLNYPILSLFNSFFVFLLIIDVEYFEYCMLINRFFIPVFHYLRLIFLYFPRLNLVSFIQLILYFQDNGVFWILLLFGFLKNQYFLVLMIFQD